jgi:hypothetical protein
MVAAFINETTPSTGDCKQFANKTVSFTHRRNTNKFTIMIFYIKNQ